jgi:hypothetical protein
MKAVIIKTRRGELLAEESITHVQYEIAQDYLQLKEGQEVTGKIVEHSNQDRIHQKYFEVYESAELPSQVAEEPQSPTSAMQWPSEDEIEAEAKKSADMIKDYGGSLHAYYSFKEAINWLKSKQPVTVEGGEKRSPEATDAFERSRNALAVTLLIREKKALEAELASLKSSTGNWTDESVEEYAKREVSKVFEYDAAFHVKYTKLEQELAELKILHNPSLSQESKNWTDEHLIDFYKWVRQNYDMMGHNTWGKDFKTYDNEHILAEYKSKQNLSQE